MKYEEIYEEHEDPLINQLHRAIKAAVRFLAALVVLVIFWTIVDVLYEKLKSPSFLLLDM